MTLGTLSTVVGYEVRILLAGEVAGIGSFAQTRASVAWAILCSGWRA
jgi:hypothetical protein